MGKQAREKRERQLNSQIQRSSLENIYLVILEGGICLALLTPLILMKQFFFPYVAPKTIYFRIIVDLLLIVYILLVLSNRRYLPRFNAVTIAVTIFIAVTALTSFTGVNLFKSFWSTFERMTGLLTLFHLYVFFIILSSVFRERKQWERFFTVSIAASLILVFYTFTTADSFSRSGGTVGNASFLAGYLLFNIFFAIILFLARGGNWRYFYGFAALLLLWLLLFPPQEVVWAAIAAFAGGALFLLAGYLLFYLFSFQKKILKIIILILAFLIIIAAFGISQTDILNGKIEAIKQSSGWQGRWIVWQIGAESWTEKFWLGWGQDNFATAFTRYFRPQLPLTADFWYDRVHNIILDTAVVSGLAGLLSYLAVFGAAIVVLLRLFFTPANVRNIFFPLGMITVLLVYFAQNIFAFDSISTYLMFFFTLAFIVFLTSARTVEAASATGPTGKVLGALLITLALFVFFWGNIRPAQAAFYAGRALRQPPEKAIADFQKAITIMPSADIAELFAGLAQDPNFKEKADKELLIKTFGLAAKTLEDIINYNPGDSRLYIFLGEYYNQFYALARDSEKLDQAEKFLKKAIELSPRNQQAYWNLAVTKLSRGDSREAVILAKKAVDLEPRLALPQWYLSMIYKELGNDSLALEELKKAEKLTFIGGSFLEYFKDVIDFYQEKQDDESLVFLYHSIIQKYSQAPQFQKDNAQFRAGLAVAYANLGRYDEAKRWAREAIRFNPAIAPELEEFIAALPSVQ